MNKKDLLSYLIIIFITAVLWYAVETRANVFLKNEPIYITGDSCGGRMYTDWPCMNHAGCIKLGQ